MKMILNDQEIAEIVGYLNNVPNDERARLLAKELIKKSKDTVTADDYREAAAQHTSEGSLEVDTNATVSMGDADGAYVQAWIWIDKSEMRQAQKHRLKEERRPPVCAGPL